MKALLIVAHGSRRKESNAEVFALTSHIETIEDGSFSAVWCAFLELTNPTVDEAVAGLAESGIQEIIVFPYFLAAGTHVANDVPRLVEQAREQYPAIRFSITAHLGGLAGIGEIILNAAKKEPRR